MKTKSDPEIIMYSFLFLALIYLTCALFSIAHAQTGETGISLQFSCLEWSEIDTNGLYYQHQEESIQVSMDTAYRSELYDYSGPNPIVFFVDSNGANGQPERRPVARAQVPEGVERALFLFVERPNPGENGEAFEVIVMDESLSAFPMGTYRVFNFSDYEIGGIIGENRFIIPGKNFKTISPKVGDMVDVQIHFSQKVDDQWVPKVNTRWLYRENARNIVFVTDDPNSRVPRLRVKTVTEYFKD